MHVSVGLYHVPLLKTFNTTAYKRLPDHGKEFATEMARLIHDFAGATTNDVLSICPQLGDDIAHWQESSMRVTSPIESQSRAIFVDGIEEHAREAHRKVKPKVLKVWTPIYKICGDAYGS